MRFSAANWAGRAFPGNKGTVILHRGVYLLFIFINLFIDICLLLFVEGYIN